MKRGGGERGLEGEAGRSAEQRAVLKRAVNAAIITSFGEDPNKLRYWGLKCAGSYLDLLDPQTEQDEIEWAQKALARLRAK